MSNIRPNGKARTIGGIDGSQSGMSTEQICDIPHVGVGYFNKNAVANILSWSKCIKLGMDLDYFKASETFVLYASDTTGWVFTGNREGLYVCRTKDMAPVELPSHFVRGQDVVAVSKVVHQAGGPGNGGSQAV